MSTCDYCGQQLIEDDECFIWDGVGIVWCSRDCCVDYLINIDGMGMEEINKITDYDEDGHIEIYYTTYCE